MLTIIKRDKREEEFNMEKITVALTSASDNISQPLNTSDINSIEKELAHLLEERTKITSYQLYTMLIGVLYARRLYDIVEEYTSNSGNAWRWKKYFFANG